MKTIHPVYIIVFGMVTGNGDIILPFIFLHSLKLNIEAYLKYVEELVLFWIERVTDKRSYIWKPDSASYHTSKRTLVLTARKFLQLRHP